MANLKTYLVDGPQRIQSVPIKSGATFKEGDFLTMTSTGADGPPTAGTNYALSNLILGRALSDSVLQDGSTSGQTLTHVEVIIAQPGTRFGVPLYNTTGATAVPALAQLVAAGYEMRNSATGFPQVDLSATTNKAFRVYDFVAGQLETPNWPDNVTGGAQYATVWVEFIGAACAMTGAK